MITQVSGIEFQELVLSSKLLSLVKFRAEWSGACHIISPLYNELSADYYGVVNFFTVDVEMDGELDKEYGVLEIPTILFFKNGKVIDHIKGLTSKNVLAKKIEQALTEAS